MCTTLLFVYNLFLHSKHVTVRSSLFRTFTIYTAASSNVVEWDYQGTHGGCDMGGRPRTSRGTGQVP